MSVATPARETLFAQLLCDVMIPAEFSAAIRAQGYDVAEARAFPLEIQQDDQAILQEQGRGRLLRAGETLRAPGSDEPQHIVGTLRCPGGPRALSTLVTDHVACDTASHPTRGELAAEAVPSCMANLEQTCQRRMGPNK